MLTMCLRQIARLVAAVLLTTCGLLSAPITTAAAQPCPDVEAVFARGTGEPPGVGGIGEPFVDSLRSAIGAKSLDVYPVNYEASSDFGDRVQFAQSVVDGIKDASGHIEATAANCPRPGSCSADTPRVRPSPVSSRRRPYQRGYRPSTSSFCPSRCRRRLLTTSPR